MKRILSLVTVLFVLFSAVAAYGEAAPEPITIGVITTLTGEKAMIGEYTQSSCELAIEEINAAGGILGRPVAVIYEDDQGTDAGAVNAFNKLASDSTIVGVIGSNSSTRNLAIESDVKKAEAEAAVEQMTKKLPKNVEITLVDGGQPVYYYFISAE